MQSIFRLTGCVFFRVIRTLPLQLLRWPTKSPSLVSPNTPPSSTSNPRSTSPASEPGQQASTATIPPPVGLPFPMEHTRRRHFTSKRRFLKFSVFFLLFVCFLFCQPVLRFAPARGNPGPSNVLINTMNESNQPIATTSDTSQQGA